MRRPPQSGRYDERERIDRRQFVLALIQAGATRDTMHEAAAQRTPPIPASTVDNIAREIRKGWRDEFTEQVKETRAEQVMRLRRDLVQMRLEQKKPWAAIRAHERLLASVEGNLAPMRVAVDVDFTLRETLGAIVSGLDAEAYEELLREQLEVERAAELGRPLLAEGVEVPQHDAEKRTA